MMALAAVGAIALIPVGIIVNGWVLSILWNWFMPISLGLPTLSISKAIGVSMVISYITYQKDAEKSGSKNAHHVFIEGLAWLVAKVGCGLLIGYIVKSFI